MPQAIPPNQTAPPPYWGEYRCSLDTDGYLLLPEQFTETMSFVLTKGLDGCLMLAPQSWFSTLRAKTRKLPFTHKLSRHFRRHLFASATQVQPDEQRRIFVPESLRTYAHLTDEVILVGNDEYLEIWNVDDWDETQTAMMDQIITGDQDWQLEGI